MPQEANTSATTAPSAHADRQLPRSITVYVAVLAMMAGAVAAVGIRIAPGAPRSPDLVALAFIPLLVLAESLMLRFRYRDQVDGCNLFEAALAPLILAYPTVTVMLIVAAAQLINGVARRNQPMKSAFNVVQWSLAAGIGSVVALSLSSGTAISAHNLVVLAVAMLAVVVVNQLAFTFVIKLARREPLRRVIAGMRPAITLSLATQIPINLTLGLLLAAAFEWSANTLLLFPLPLVMLYWALRSHTVAIAERSRAVGVRSAVRTLGEQRSDDAIPRFLAHVRVGFDAQAVELALAEKRGRVIYRVAEDSGDEPETRREPSSAVTLSAALMRCDRPTRITKDSDDMLAALLRNEGWRDCLAAPLAIEGRTAGVLCIYDRSGFDGLNDDELSVLQLLADEAATSRRNAFLETQLEARDQLGDMVNRTSDGLAGVAPDGVIKMWNPALERITGYSAEEMINTRQLGAIRPKDRNGEDVMIEYWARSSRPLPETMQIRTRDGELRWLSCSQTILPGSSFQPAMLVLLMRDTTRSRELERLKDEFAATVSHELRAPLTPIKGWAATLLLQGDRVSSSEREEGVRRILVQAEHLEKIIEGLLDMARIEGGEKGRFEPMDVVPVVSHVIEEIRQEHPRRKIRLASAAKTAHPLGNEGWIGQIVRNLLTNAVKYSPASEPVDVSIDEVAGLLTISVTDHGAGISAADRDRIFERYQRLDRDRGRAQGVGLGLHIASQLAQAMEGSIAVKSEPGAGSTFTLTLPAVNTLSVVG